ncbi:MAG: TonB family protein, partial [bacterium]
MIDNYTDGYVVTCPVEKSGRNDWGLCGVGGNVWEICAADAAGASFGAWRGASWYRTRLSDLRCACRRVRVESDRDFNSGFRLVLSRSNQSCENEIPRCVSLVRNALYEAWEQPKQSEGGSRPAKLYIRLDASGRVINYRITQSSGSTIFDTSVLKAAANCPPVRGLTADFLKKYDELTIEFRLE